MTTVINIRSDLSTLSERYVYIGRGKEGRVPNTPGEYGWRGNPVVLYRECPECGEIHSENGDTLACYEVYLRRRLREKAFRERFLQLNGAVLGCFCKPKPCHGDVIVRVLDEILNEKD